VPGDDRIQRTTVVDSVTTRLRRDILTGEIPPGGRILLGDLERRFGVSHIPIREAIRRLESEGLVVTSPQRSTIAAGLALEDLTGLYDLRRLVEVPVARRAAEQATDADRRATSRALAALEKAYESPKADFWEPHRAFHAVMLAPGMTTWVQRVIDQTWQVSERYTRLTASAFGTMEGAMQDHRAMERAFVAGDGAEVGELLLQHLTRTEEALTNGYLAWQADEAGSGEATA
jgi:DNA-binding GntR family transcriptional regulator